MLQRAAERAQAGSGQIVAVVAEPGVGKSRLFFEFKAEAQSGWTVLEAFSVSHGKGSAYLPIVELLHSYFEFGSGDSASVRREKIAAKIAGLDPNLETALPYLYALLEIADDKDRLAGMDAQLRKSRILEAVTRLFLAEADRRPLILMVEDLHWLDDSQALLDRIADVVGNSRMLLLVNYHEYAHRWGDKSCCVRLRLETPLVAEAPTRCCRQSWGTTRLSCHSRTYHHDHRRRPLLFMEETVQVLFDEGALKRQNGAVKLIRPLNSLKIPPTVQAILAAHRSFA